MRAGEREAEEFFNWRDMLRKDQPDGRAWVGVPRTSYALTFMEPPTDYHEMNVMKVLLAPHWHVRASAPETLLAGQGRHGLPLVTL
jgi:hypothetical protein